MAPVIVKYPLDLTGENPGNKVVGEPKVLRTTRTRVICTNYGAFYSKSLVLRDVTNNRQLVPGVDFYTGWLYQIPTKQTGEEVCALIVVTNPDVSTNVTVDYQVLGGEYSYSYDAIVQMIEALDLDNRPVEWGNIINKPDAFAAAPHLHDVGDVYGFEYVVQAIHNLTQAIQLGSAASEKQIYTYIDNADNYLNNKIDNVARTAGSKEGIIQALGYTPVDPANATFTKPVNFNSGVNINRWVKEAVRTTDANTALTTVDVSLAPIQIINIHTNTSLVFDLSGIEDLKENESISFTLILVNKTDGRAVAFPAPVQWSDKQTPPRTTALNGRDEYYFSTFNSGTAWTGSLSDSNVG